MEILEAMIENENIEKEIEQERDREQNRYVKEREKVRMFKIRRIDISFLHCVICLQLLLLCFPEVVSMNAFLNDQINIFCCKRLKS